MPAEFAEILATGAELNRLVAHAMLSPREMVCLVRFYVHDLKDDEEMEGEETLGVKPQDRRVYRHRALQKLSATQRFFARIDALPVDCRSTVLAVYTHGGPPAAIENRDARVRGEEILLAEGYVAEVRDLGAEGGDQGPVPDTDVALLHHGDEHATINDVAARVGCSVADAAASLRRTHRRIHEVRLARFVSAGKSERKRMLETIFIGDLSALDDDRRRLAVQVCVRRLALADAAKLAKITVPALKAGLLLAQGVPDDVDDKGEA